jgi:formylglycine-generating enzyme required for sulfatase activity
MLIGKQSGTYGIIEELGREGQPVWRAGYGGQRMVGWCDSGYYSQSPVRNPPGPDSGEGRVLRGGSWYGSQRNARCTYRNWGFPGNGIDIVGFRCARGSE